MGIEIDSWVKGVLLPIVHVYYELIKWRKIIPPAKSTHWDVPAINSDRIKFGFHTVVAYLLQFVHTKLDSVCYLFQLLIM